MVLREWDRAGQYDPARGGFAAWLSAAARNTARNLLAQAERVPAYVVFSNATLSDMAARAPATLDELLQVTGVGQLKAARYGRAFLEAIAAYQSTAE